ncbi:MAG TPA: energy-coupling factor ABC transporter ATP-binding protein, partial [Solirubrobacterales bacterium]|nr:energy-coupling factor ABC transporter ATP-binding protein [Solirubrobacterales bacterium]
ALRARDLWVELGDGDGARDVLRGLDLTVAPGERVALMGRNGAGKSTLLRALAGLVKPVRGRSEAPGGVALLTQSPGDYLVRERVGDELPGEAGAAALARVGLTGLEDADPRDLSGGQRQRLALAITLAGRTGPGEAAERPAAARTGAGPVPGLIALDEPTRGLDRGLEAELVEFASELAAAGAAVVIATHAVEFAAAFADRVVLLGDGELIADGPAGEVLSGGWYFATEVARVLDRPGVITPEQGALTIARDRGAA